MISIAGFLIIEEAEKFHFIFVDEEKTILLKSISYEAKDECLKAMLLVKKYGVSEDNYLRMMSPDYKYYFILRDGNLKELASARIVKSKTERNQFIAECIRFIKSASFKLPFD